MLNARRAARELALKVLFQIDVGKQPLDEVLEGALEQVRQTVDHPVSQPAHDLQAELKAAIEERRPDLSTQSLRQVRNVAKTLGAEMATLVDSASGQATLLVGRPRDISTDVASKQVEQDVEAATRNMRRASERETLQPELVNCLVGMGLQRAGQVPSAFRKNAAQAYSTAMFLHTLVEGVLATRKEIDERVAELSEGWALDRQPAVDRNILRIAAFEVMFMPDIPAGASINEAVELAKKYSTAESGKFVNGVLGTLAKAVGKDANAPVPVTATEEGQEIERTDS